VVYPSLEGRACRAELGRFCARRGLPVALYSDNGTNFIATRREMLEVKQALDEVYPRWAAKRNVQWNTIPQASPHMGGLWETGVKSAKLHLKKTIGKSLNFRRDVYPYLRY
jgi:hypothetical protein